MKQIISGVSMGLFTALLFTSFSVAQYGDPGPPPAPDTPRAEDPKEIMEKNPAFAPDTVLDAPDPALDQGSVIDEPESFDMNPGPGGIVTEPENVNLPPGAVETEPNSMVEQREPLVDGDPMVRQPEALVEQPEPLVNQPDPLVEQPPALVEQSDPLVKQPPAMVDQPAPIVPEGEPMDEHGARGRGIK